MTINNLRKMQQGWIDNRCRLRNPLDTNKSEVGEMLHTGEVKENVRMPLKSETQENPISYAAREAYNEANGDLDAAQTLLEKRAKKESSLRESLIKWACHEAIRAAGRRFRDQIWNRPVEPPVDHERDQRRVRALAAGTLMMFPLPGGKLLADATGDEVLDVAAAFEAQAMDMAIKARWLRLVGQAAGRRKVGKALTEEKLSLLRQEASHA